MARTEPCISITRMPKGLAAFTRIFNSITYEAGVILSHGRTGQRCANAWYTGTRLHSALGYQAPAEYEAAARQNDPQAVA